MALLEHAGGHGLTVWEKLETDVIPGEARDLLFVDQQPPSGLGSSRALKDWRDLGLQPRTEYHLLQTNMCALVIAKHQ